MTGENKKQQAYHWKGARKNARKARAEQKEQTDEKETR